MKQFKGVYPISGEDLNALPVKEIGPAVEFYTNVLAFSVVARDDTTATIQRDDARLGLVRKPDHKPEEAGSCAFSVTDLDAMRAEMVARMPPGQRGGHAGGRVRGVVFVRRATGTTRLGSYETPVRAHLGRKASEESRRRMSAAHRARGTGRAAVRPGGSWLPARLAVQHGSGGGGVRPAPRTNGPRAPPVDPEAGFINLSSCVSTPTRTPPPRPLLTQGMSCP